MSWGRLEAIVSKGFSERKLREDREWPRSTNMGLWTHEHMAGYSHSCIGNWAAVKSHKSTITPFSSVQFSCSVVSDSLRPHES